MLNHTVTGDETLVSHIKPDSKHVLWIQTVSSTVKENQADNLNKKDHVYRFLERILLITHVIFLKEFVPRGSIINSTDY